MTIAVGAAALCILLTTSLLGLAEERKATEITRRHGRASGHRARVDGGGQPGPGPGVGARPAGNGGNCRPVARLRQRRNGLRRQRRSRAHRRPVAAGLKMSQRAVCGEATRDGRTGATNGVGLRPASRGAGAGFPIQCRDAVASRTGHPAGRPSRRPDDGARSGSRFGPGPRRSWRDEGSSQRRRDSGASHVATAVRRQRGHADAGCAPRPGRHPRRPTVSGAWEQDGDSRRGCSGRADRVRPAGHAAHVS